MVFVANRLKLLQIFHNWFTYSKLTVAIYKMEESVHLRTKRGTFIKKTKLEVYFL